VRADRKKMVVRINTIMDHVEEVKEKVVAAKRKNKDTQAKPRSPSPSSSSDAGKSDKGDKGDAP